MKGLVCFVCAFSLVLGACDLAPADSPPQMALPLNFKEGSPWQIANPRDDLPRGPWWTEFHDKTLDALEPRIESANQTLAEALANYVQATANVDQAESGLYPSLEQDTSASTNRQSDHRPLRSASQPSHYGANTLGIQASYEVDLWGRVRDTIKASTAEAQAQSAILENVRLSLHAELARVYLALRSLDRESQLLADTEKTYQQALELTQNRLAGKIAPPIDVARAQAQLATAQALIADTFGRRALLEHAIASLIGEPASSFSIPPSTLIGAMPRPPRVVPSTLLERRPDIAADERDVAAANAKIGIARAAFYPRFFLNLQGGTQDTGFHLLDLKNEFFAIGPSVALPIFDGGKRAADLKFAEAARDAAAAHYRGQVLRAIQEVEDSLAQERWLGIEAKRVAESVDAAKRVLDYSLTLYRDGATTYLDVVTAQTAALDAERTALALQTRRLQAAVALILALGGGWSEPVRVAAISPPLSTLDVLPH